MFLHDKDPMEEFQNPHSKHARLENFESDPYYWTKNDTSEPDGAGEEVGLSLRLGLGQNSCISNNGSKLSRGFTFLQIQELQHQSLIFKYMEAGLPVPLHLLVPIWKSVNGCFSHHFPAFIGGNGNAMMYLEYGKSLDPEPGRCRRTDGKKWRCSKEAVANHKYCERHMHRGRHQRSRKLVEASSAASGDVDMALHLRSDNTNLSISLPSSVAATNNTRRNSVSVSVSPSGFVFSAKKAESSLCF